MTLTELVTGKVKDDSGKLGLGDIDAGVAEAIKRYSKVRPQIVCADLAGAGSNDLPLPVDWSPEFSSIVSIEYPLGNVPAVLLDRDLFQLYRAPAGLKLRILHTAIDVGESVRCEYSLLHSETTLPEADLEAVANLAASLCLLQLAAAYGQPGDSTIQADTVNYHSKTDGFRRLADSFEGLYKNHLGLKDNDTVAAALTTARPPANQRPRLTHGRG